MGIASATSSSRNTYASIPKETYALKRDYNASTRLTAQHYLWKDTLHFNLHPQIPLDPSHARVADVATGNGIWLLDLARDLPRLSKLDGFDISLDQCPPSSWLPSNINLHTWNIFDEPPSEFVEAFDVVHVRLITVVIQNNDPRPVLKNLRKLLKPGGYLQWDEADSVDWTVKTTGTSASTGPVGRLFQQLCGTDDWKRSMVETLNGNGFQRTELHRFEYEENMARYWNDMYMSTWDEFAKKVLRKPDESAQLSIEAMDQVRNGSAISCPKLVWVSVKI